MAKPPAGAPYVPPTYDAADLGAIQALQRGDATEEQQRRAWAYIVEKLCGTYELSYRPTGDRDTCFAEGRRFVGLQLRKLIVINPAILRTDDGRRSERSAEQRPSRRPAAGRPAG